MKNKYISVSTYSKTHHKFNGLYFMWSQDWNVDGEKLDRSFSMKFYPDEPAEGDTAHYAVCVKANFDLKLDSSACFKNADNINYKVLSFSENEIMVEMYRSHFKDFNELLNSFNVDIIGHAKVFDDDDTPYVNFFIGFDDQALVIDPSKQSSDIRIFFNSEYMDGFANMPYDIQMVKPEPASNCPWHLFYGVYRKDSINVVNEVQDVVDHGLYISTVNRELKQKKDRESFFYSILIGALVSFLFSILINLFIKWRNLNQSEGNSDPFSSTNTKKE